MKMFVAKYYLLSGPWLFFDLIKHQNLLVLQRTTAKPPDLAISYPAIDYIASQTL